MDKLKQKLKPLTVAGIVTGVLLFVAGLIVTIYAAVIADADIVPSYIAYGADYYTDSYEAMATTANNLFYLDLKMKIAAVSLGLIMLFAGIIVSLVYVTKLIKLNYTDSCEPTETEIE